MRSVLRRSLERAGHKAIEASNGRMGLKALQQQKVELVVTDIIMPEVEGLELIQGLQRTHPELPIIAISGGGRLEPEGYLKLAEAFGAAKVLRKPFGTEEFLAAIASVLARDLPTS
ncbi:MAG: response regulator [Deltaproteobacteria bacterium]|nr:response regulator [Deltaproteobacteria bacterium]